MSSKVIFWCTFLLFCSTVYGQEEITDEVAKEASAIVPVEPIQAGQSDATNGEEPDEPLASESGVVNDGIIPLNTTSPTTAPEIDTANNVSVPPTDSENTNDSLITSSETTINTTTEGGFRNESSLGTADITGIPPNSTPEIFYHNQGDGLLEADASSIASVNLTTLAPETDLSGNDLETSTGNETGDVFFTQPDFGISDSSTTTGTTISATSSANGTVVATTVPKKSAFWYEYGLLIAGITLFIGILAGMFYACCCMKNRRSTVVSRTDVEHNRGDTVPISRQIDHLNKSNTYVDEVITSTSHQYRETRREPFAASLSSKPDQLNHTAAKAKNVSIGPNALENQNSKFSPVRSFHDGKSAASGNTAIPIGSPLDGGPRAQSWTRRLDAPSDSRDISSRDVISASRVNNAVATVAAAGAAPLRGTIRTDLETVNDPVIIRGGTLPDRATSPNRPLSYTTTLNFTPHHNRDPNSPPKQGDTLPYGQYIGAVKGPSSDFAQFSPDPRPASASRERRLLGDGDNVESNV